MTSREQLLKEIDAFLAKHGMSATRFGTLAANDTALVSKMKNGRSVRVDMFDRLRRFMAAYRPPKDGKPRPSTAATAA